MRQRSVQRAFDERGPWITRFTFEGRRYGGAYEAVDDQRITTFLRRFPVDGKRILELGPLEGGHTLALSRAGAREIVAIEGRAENLRRCLLVKELFRLNNVCFQLGDIREVTRETHGVFDAAICVGVLYHVPDPEVLLAALRALAPVTLLWTHIADQNHPEGAHEGELRSQYGTFRGKLLEEDTSHPLSALDKKVMWLYKRDLLNLIRAIGFRECELLRESPAGTSPGPAVLAVLSA